MQPDNSLESSSADRTLIAFGFPGHQSVCGSSFNSPPARALTPSENHKEAERRRRQRINAHLDSLRSILLCNSKTDKASLLAKAVERVRELKQQTSEIMKSDATFPSEADEIIVMRNHEAVGRTLIEASICCEDRDDLMPELMEVLKPLRLSLVRAEVVTLGGRIKNAMVLVGEDKDRIDESVLLLRDALRRMVLSSGCGDGGWAKRRRMFDPRSVGYD